MPGACQNAGQALELRVCQACTGAVVPETAPDPNAGRCRWCRWCGQVCLESRPVCSRGVHFRGQCRWNCGASPLYATTELETHWCCPDCTWLWVRALAAEGRSTAAEESAAGIVAHMQSLVETCALGAGSEYAVTVPVSPRPRRVRRWITTHLSDSRWSRVTEVVRACQAAMPDCDSGKCEESARESLAVLHRQCRLSFHGTGRNLAVRPAGWDTPAHRAVHSHRFRRRRSARAAFGSEPTLRAPRRRVE